MKFICKTTEQVWEYDDGEELDVGLLVYRIFLASMIPVVCVGCTVVLVKLGRGFNARVHPYFVAHDKEYSGQVECERARKAAEAAEADLDGVAACAPLTFELTPPASSIDIDNDSIGPSGAEQGEEIVEIANGKEPVLDLFPSDS